MKKGLGHEWKIVLFVGFNKLKKMRKKTGGHKSTEIWENALAK